MHTYTQSWHFIAHSTKGKTQGHGEETHRWPDTLYSPTPAQSYSPSM